MTRKHTRKTWNERRRAPLTQADFLARAKKNKPVRIALLHPFSWWRTRQPEEFKKVDVPIARHFLTKTAIIGEPHWFLAVAGDAAVAIGVALRAQKRSNATLVTLDVAMTAVLCVALEGNITAVLLLSNTLKRCADSNPHCGMLSDSWLAYRPDGRRPSGRPNT